MNDSIFDSSIAEVVYKQDTATATYYELSFDSENNPILDRNNLQEVDTIAFPDYYINNYSSSRTYEPFSTVHTQGGWFIQQDQLVSGFKDGVHAVLESVNYGGSGLVLLPSATAYGRNGTFGIDPNTVIMFEIRPVEEL